MSEFSDTLSKLTAPTKKSIFEKQRAEAEAKKAREQAETAAVLREFEASFDGDDDRPPLPSQRFAPPPAVGRRHFTSTSLKSGPGTLPRSGPGSLGPAPARKRPFDDYNERKERHSALSYSTRRESQDEDGKEDEKAAKPTLLLSSMPPGTSIAVIKGFFAQTPLTIDDVRVLPTSDTLKGHRKAMSAIVTLAAETPASDIDTTVSHLQNNYLGFGFKLSIARHLSSAVTSSVNVTTAGPHILPFGAKPVQQNQSLSRAPPPGQFAPPASYVSSVPYSRAPPTQVVVQPPSDLKQLKLIHKTLEALLSHGPEFEALLMSRLEVQKDEKWAWLWDSNSLGGVYYRWRLWEILTNAGKRQKQRGPAAVREFLFEGQSSWLAPEHALRFEYTTQIDEFISDGDYNSSDEEDDESGLARRYNDHNFGASGLDDTKEGAGYLDPLAKAKLTHLLSRLPDSTSKLRRGDVARLTAFAIEHAGAGGEEVANLVTRNAVKPFRKLDHTDSTSASMVGLYVISDILSCSASAGVRHAWRYRTLFDQALRQQKVFERLGRAEKEHQWGKLKGEKWKRSVQNLLGLWESWSVFPQSSQEELTKSFLEPPLTEEEKNAASTLEKDESEQLLQKTKSATKWKSVDDETLGDTAMDDIDGMPLVDDDEEELDFDVDGIPMEDSSDEEQVKQEDKMSISAMSGEERLADPISIKPVVATLTPGAKRQRPKAADLFADGDD